MALSGTRRTEPGAISGHDKNIYHLLCGAFGQCVSITKVIDFNVLNVVPICDIHIAIDVARTRARVWTG